MPYPLADAEIHRAATSKWFQRIPNLFDALHFPFYFLRQWVYHTLQTSPMREWAFRPWKSFWWRVLRIAVLALVCVPIVLAFIAIELPLILLNQATSPTAWRRRPFKTAGYVLVTVGIGLVLTINSVAWCLVIVAAVLALFFHYYNTHDNHTVLYEFLLTRHLGDTPHIGQLIDVLDIVGADLQQQTGLPYLKYKPATLKHYQQIRGARRRRSYQRTKIADFAP